MRNIKRLVRYDWPLHFVLLATNWLPDNIKFIRLRGKMASPFFKSCGKHLGLGRNITFYNPSKISIGSNVYIARGCWFSAGFGINIEDEVLFGPYVVVAASNHTKKNGSFRFAPPKGNKIIVKKGSWIASHCTITAGAVVGEGSVIGANSVVTKAIDANVLAAGNPAKAIKPV